MYKRLLLVGDSQTQSGAQPHGWVTHLSDTFCRQVDITNRGLSGYNTRWILDYLPSIIPVVPAYHFDLAVVWLGCNDAVKPGAVQHVPQEDYSNNLTLIVCHLMNIGVLPANILVLTPPTVDEDMLVKSFPGGDRTNALMRRYADIALNVAKTRECEFSDLFKVFEDSAKPGSELFTDGLHLGKCGNRLVSDVVCRFLLKRVQTGSAVPDWKDLISEP